MTPDSLEHLRLRIRPIHRITFRLWREWCFVQAAVRRMGWRLIVMAVILFAGGQLFQQLEPEKDIDAVEGMFYTWSLIFGETPESFPKSGVLRVMFFLVPLFGIMFIIEGVVELALLVRDRRRCERDWCKTMARSMSNHVILVGCGKLGFRVFKLLRRLGEQVVVIERDERARFLDEIRRDGAPLLIGDARDESILHDANLDGAKSIVLASNDDLGNLEIALDARRLKPEIRVILRMFDQNMADKIRDGFNIHIAMSQSATSAPRFAMSAIDPSIVNSFVLGDQLIVMYRWKVAPGGPLDGKTVGQVMDDMACGVARVSSGNEPARVFPPPNTLLKVDDDLLVQGPFETLSELKRA